MDGICQNYTGLQMKTLGYASFSMEHMTAATSNSETMAKQAEPEPVIW